MSESIADTKARLEAFVLETAPTADIAPGTVLSELLIKLAATLQNPIKNDLVALEQTNSITKALESPEDTYSDIVDNVAANYSIYRNAGAKSTGKLKITVNGNDSVYVDKDFMFTQPVLKLNYIVTANYRATTNPTAVNEVKLMKINNSSLYYFIIPVEAEDIGSHYKLSDQTSLSPVKTDVISTFVDAKAYGNFSDGLNKETDKELISRFSSGLTHKTLLTKDSIFFRAKELYPNLKDISVITVNDAELTRAKQNVFGISTLGMSDVYVKSSFGLETAKLTLSATKTAEGEWTMAFGGDDAAGFYRVLSILPQNSGLVGSLLFDIDYDYNTSTYSVANTINNLYEARFSKYQRATATIEFVESELEGRSVSVPIGTKELFDVLVVHQPNIKDIQDLLLSPDERILCADYLVKAALPCFVTVKLKIARKDVTKEFPIDLLKQDIFKYINSLKFGDVLYASAIVDICHNYDIKTVQLPIKLTGEIYSDHSTLVTINSTDSLVIPTKLNLGISKKTVVFVSNYFSQTFDPGSNLTDAIGIEII